MKLFKGLDLDEFTEAVMKDEELKDIDDDVKRCMIVSFVRGFNDACGIMEKRMENRVIAGMLIGAILCVVGSAIGESIKIRKK